MNIIYIHLFIFSADVQVFLILFSVTDGIGCPKSTDYFCPDLADKCVRRFFGGHDIRFMQIHIPTPA